MMIIKKRLRLLEKMYGGRLDFADMCGVSERTISNTLYRRGGFSEATLMAFHDNTNVSIDWLLGLTGTDDTPVFIGERKKYE